MKAKHGSVINGLGYSCTCRNKVPRTGFPEKGRFLRCNIFCGIDGTCFCMLRTHISNAEKMRNVTKARGKITDKKTIA